MLRCRAPAQAGAAALLASLLASVLATGGLGAVDAAAAVAASSHAEAAADAVAHGVASLLAGHPDRDRLSLAVQAGEACERGSPPGPSTGKACADALALAIRLAAANGAAVMRLSVGPDPRDLRADRGAGRLLTLAEVAVPRGLPVLPGRCPPAPGSQPDLCWAMAWSAAQEAG